MVKVKYINFDDLEKVIEQNKGQCKGRVGKPDPRLENGIWYVAGCLWVWVPQE